MTYCAIDEPDASNRVGGVLVIATETTATVMPEKRRAVEAHRQQRLLEQAPGFVNVMRGPEHVVEFVNREHRRLFWSDGWPGKPICAARAGIEGQGFFGKACMRLGELRRRGARQPASFGNS